jgi:hypothetical protein
MCAHCEHSLVMKDRKIVEKWTTDECRRIVGFFALLLKVDRRVNPHLYEAVKKNSTGASPTSK